MCSSLGSASLGLSELPGLPDSLFPLPDWGSSPALFFKEVFNFLLILFSSGTPYDSDVGMFQVVLEFRKPLLILKKFLFLHSVLVECLFIPSPPNG